MKFNWGSGIALTLVSFTGLMSFMVYKAMQQDFDLVSENYYAEEIAFQDVIDRKTNALKLNGSASLSLSEEGIFLHLPTDLEEKLKDIDILMYYELEADNDFEMRLEQTTENRVKIDFPQFSAGKWIAKVTVRCEDVEYYFDPEIIL